MSTHSISTRLTGDAHAYTCTYKNRLPTLIVWDPAAEFDITFPADMDPITVVKFAVELAAAADKFAVAVKAEAARRIADRPEEAAA